jgi:hypothetical protein
MDAGLQLLLLVLFAGMLLCILCLLWLGALVPRDSSAGRALFSYGTLWPYNFVVSLRGRFFLPWVAHPDFSGCKRSARFAFRGARFGACVVMAALVSMAALTAWHIWA